MRTCALASPTRPSLCWLDVIVALTCSRWTSVTSALSVDQATSHFACFRLTRVQTIDILPMAEARGFLVRQRHTPPPAQVVDASPARPAPKGAVLPGLHVQTP